MAVVDARVLGGKLTFKASGDATFLDFSCQATKLAIVPSVNEEDPITVLCGDKVGGGSKVDDSLQATIIADWNSANSLISWAWRHRGETVDFDIQFDRDATKHWTGKVVVQALEVGGEVDTQTTIDLDWKIVSMTPPSDFGDGLLHSTPVVPITGIGTTTGSGKQVAFLPANATPPKDLAALKAHPVIGDAGTASPSSAFAAGTYVVLGDGSKANWDGSAWQAGAHA